MKSSKTVKTWLSANTLSKESICFETNCPKDSLLHSFYFSHICFISFYRRYRITVTHMLYLILQTNCITLGDISSDTSVLVYISNHKICSVFWPHDQCVLWISKLLSMWTPKNLQEFLHSSSLLYSQVIRFAAICDDCGSNCPLEMTVIFTL